MAKKKKAKAKTAVPAAVVTAPSTGTVATQSQPVQQTASSGQAPHAGVFGTGSGSAPQLPYTYQQTYQTAYAQQIAASSGSSG